SRRPDGSAERGGPPAALPRTRSGASSPARLSRSGSGGAARAGAPAADAAGVGPGGGSCPPAAGSVTMPPQERARSLPEVDDALAGLARTVERHSRMSTAGRGETASLAAVVDQLSSSLRVATEAWSAPSTWDDEEKSEDQPTETAQGTQGAEQEPEPAEVLPSWLVTTD